MELQHRLAQESAQPSLILVADIDDFKRINAVYGRAEGDAVIVQLARRLQLLKCGNDVIARTGGDNFAWLHTALADTHTDLAACSIECTTHLHDVLTAPILLASGLRVQITASIGWAGLDSRRAQKSADAALGAAELAVNAAKAGGRDQVRAYEAHMLSERQRREELAQELQTAVIRNELALHPQLQVDRAGRPVSAELLLRWTRRNGEQISPSAFIPLAERSGVMPQIGTWALRRTCELLSAWTGKPRLGDLNLAVNVSACQFRQAGFVERVRSALVDAATDPTRLTIEITESSALGDLSGATRTLASLRDLGVRVSLDDFGTGYSSIAYLARLPLDQLKIDKSFVDAIPDAKVGTALVESIIGMAHALQLQVVAEGVETEAQHAFLYAHGCDTLQGYRFAKPMALTDFEAMITTPRGFARPLLSASRSIPCVPRPAR